jgi:putative redox protein
MLSPHVQCLCHTELYVRHHAQPPFTLGPSLANFQVQITGTPWKFVIDEPESDGGKNQNANPMQFFIGSLVSCENELAAVVASELKIKIEKIEWDVELGLNLDGFEGEDLKLEQPYTSARITATVVTDGTAEQVASLAASLHARCPIRRLLVNSGVDVQSEITKA